MPNTRGENSLRRPHTGRQIQLFKCLEKNYALSKKQLSRKMKVSVRSIERYLPVLLEHKVVEVKFTDIKGNSKKPTHFYSIMRNKL